EILFSKEENSGNVTKYITLCSTKFKNISRYETITNSDILSDNSGAEYVIISSKKFSNIAEKFENYRKYSSPHPINTKLFYVEDIFTQFNSGILDPTAIRDFIKYAFDNWQIKPFYILLLGDGDYDYLNLENFSSNFIPTYQTESSLNEVFSYPTDDYYGRIIGGKADLAVDVAIGRLPIRSIEQGELILKKIIDYEADNDKSLWKNLITLVADDGLTSTGDDGSIHTSQSERLARDYVPQYFDLNKIYLSAYPTVITGLGRRKPTVTNAIVNAVNNGTLILNYIGHGNPDVWAHEYVFERTSTIPLFKNEKQFFLTAATCDFGKYDDPVTQSATEDMIFMQNAGMIGGFSACRPVVSGENAALNNLFYSYLFSTNEGLINTIGRAYWQTKQTRFQANDEKFHLFCDPYLRLAQPNKQVKIDSVNGESSVVLAELKALGQGNIVGSVIDSSGNIDNSFNGEGILTVYDSEKSFYLSDIQLNMTLQGGVIFRGRVSINNGKFSSDFIVPKDISYENKTGKIVVYVYNNNTDGVGYSKNIKVNGTDTSVVNDKKGPEIEIFADELTFDNAKLVKPDFHLLVKLFDETGLNTTGTGLGHKLEGVINNDLNNSVDFANYFLGDLDSGGKSGVIKYKFTNLAEGDFNIRIKAWDVFNNFNEQIGYFTVVNGDDLIITDLVNYPNPFSESTTFTFQHNLSETINVKIKIYTVAGRLIKEIEEHFINDRFIKIFWNGIDEDNNKLSNGTYLYKAIVETTDGRFKKSILGKLAIIK
ncbi:MAG TPA: type IX secretion system sortase PorU, partial [Melioribacteraceae bacterium]|nr:type IX secretion system sortase PorU [Melioribacteraceae bacterium]